MNKPFFVLSPCGTSLLTNGVSQELRSIINKNANVQNRNQIPQNEISLLEEREHYIRQKLADADTNDVIRMSAELNGIIKLTGHGFAEGNDYHLLLCTDTWLGEMTARVAEEWLRSKGVTVEIRRQKDLQTADLQAFQLALSEIVKWCEQEITDWRKSHHTVFNLTGGFKSVQGFLQTLAAFYADESVYVFETADLLRIPSLPVRMDAQSVVRENLHSFRRLNLGLKVSDISGIPEIFILQLEGETAFSAWGELVWKQTKKQIYRDVVYPSPCERVKYGPDFLRSVRDLSPNRRSMVNNKVDDLTRYLESEGEDHIKSLDLKQLKGNPKPPSTHEIDAWADQDAKRIFGHYEGNVFVLDKLGKHL